MGTAGHTACSALDSVKSDVLGLPLVAGAFIAGVFSKFADVKNLICGRGYAFGRYKGTL